MMMAPRGVAAFIGVIVACAAGAAAQLPRFVNVTTTATQGIPAHGAHGIAYGDIDNDGDVEVFVSNIRSTENTTLPDELYLNLGGFVFREESATRGIAATTGEAHAAVFADVDGDGFLDLFKGDTNGSNELYMNDQRGFFVLATNRGIKTTINPPRNLGTRGVGCGDFDGDGDIDLFAGSYGQANELYINDGSGVFTEEAVRRGVDDQNGNNAQTQGCTVVDYDGDGDLDIFLSKRFGPNRLYRNDGRGFFTEVAASAGLAMPNRDCEGAVFGDTDNDGDLDVIIARTTGGGTHGYFKQTAAGRFTEQGNQLSLDRCYSINMEDLDHDGDLDVVMTFNARAAHQAYLNDGTGRFTNVNGLGFEVVGSDLRCAAFADLDNDGDRDFIVVDRNRFNQFYEHRGFGATVRHYLAVRVRGPRGQPSMPGARVELYRNGQGGNRAHLLQVRAVGGTGDGYCRADDHVAWFGVPAGRYDVQVRLPSGEVVRRPGVTADQTIVIDPTPPTPFVTTPVRVGATAFVAAVSPRDANRFYILAASLTPGSFPVSPTDRRHVPIGFDPFLQASIANSGNAFPFTNFQGTLNGSGQGLGAIAIPNLPGLVGLTIRTAYAVLDSTFPNNLATVSRAANIVIR